MIKTTGELIQAWRDQGPIAWAESPYGWITEENRPAVLTLWQRAVLDAWWESRGEITTLAISNVKKTGKTWLNGLLTAWRWLALPGQHFCLGNDLDQSLSRQFAIITEMVARNAYLADNVKIGRTELLFTPTGSRLTTLSVDAAGNAGANHLTASHTEAWGVIFESSIRAYEEMTMPPGKVYGFPALRIVDSYAGFEGESDTWHGLVDRGLAGERISKDWPIYKAGGQLLFHAEGAEARELCFRGSKDEADAYYRDQQSTLRPNAFIRMHANQRTSGESAFLPDGAWDCCYSESVKALGPKDKRKIVLGADASTSRDLTALVGTYYYKTSEITDVVYCRTWKPQKGFLRLGKPTVDLEETIGREVERLHKEGVLAAVVCDPYQLHSLIIRWEKQGIKVIELAQNAGRVESDQGLYDAVISRQIRHYNDPTLNEHMRNAVAIETPRGFRLAKEKSSLKIDAAVALSMSRWGSIELDKTDNDYPIFSVDSFLEVGLEEFARQANEQWTLTQRTAVHPPGITWKNCPHRESGCVACKLETEDMVDALGNWVGEEGSDFEIPPGAHVSSVPSQEFINGMIRRAEQEYNQEARDQKILDVFYRGAHLHRKGF